MLVVNVRSIEKERGSEKTNLYFFFIGMVYLLLNSDSKYLYEFAFLLTQTKWKYKAIISSRQESKISFSNKSYR